jgi:hypothetical protein
VKRKVNYIGRKIEECVCVCVCVCCIYSTPHHAMHCGLACSFEQSSFLFVNQAFKTYNSILTGYITIYFFLHCFCFPVVEDLLVVSFVKSHFIYSRSKIGIKKKKKDNIWQRTIKHTPFRSLHENFQFNP